MPLAHRFPPVPLLGLVLLAAALAACGSSSTGDGIAAKAPAEIVAAAEVAADTASSVHVSGSIVSGGSPITLDLDLLAGKGARGWLSENGLGFELIQTGASVYIKGSSAFYRHIGGAAAAGLLEGRWLKAPVSSTSFASLASLTDLRQLVDTAFASHGALTKGPLTTVAGQHAVGVSEPSSGGTLYIATSGRPYPIQISAGGANGSKISFDHWDEHVSLAPPANAVDIAQLQSGL
jgi:hypothetical protein